MFTADEWLARQKQLDKGVGSSGTGDRRGRGYGKQKNSRGGGGRGQGAGRGNGSASTPRRKGDCRYCGIAGHWVKECRKKARDREQHQDQPANIAQVDVEQPGLLLAACITQDNINVVTIPREPAPQEIYLNEARVVPVPTDDDRWYLDTGANNHMTGHRDLLCEINKTI